MSGPRVIPSVRAPEISEREFTAQVLDIALTFRWLRAHFRPARTAAGWRTPVAGDGKGFLDLTLLRGPRLIVAELKVGKGKLTSDQVVWKQAWEDIPCAEVYIWTPPQFEEIVGVLR